MSKTILNILIKRGVAQAETWQDFLVTTNKQASVLSALQQIYEETDSSLAFRQECRIGHCGLCGMMVNGRAKLACKTLAEPNLRLEPLKGLRQIRDLVTDRTFLHDFAIKNSLFLTPNGNKESNLGLKHYVSNEASHNYLKCLECLCCIVECPLFIKSAGKFPAPYLWVKLAQLHTNPMNMTDRKAQARMWGIKDCLDCQRCSCAEGVAIKSAIKLLTT